MKIFPRKPAGTSHLDITGIHGVSSIGFFARKVSTMGFHRTRTHSSGYSSISSKHVHCGSTAQQQSAFTFEAGPTRETTALCYRRWSWVGFTREAESPCPRVEGPTPPLATKRSLAPGVLYFFSLVPGARWYPTRKPRQSFSTLKPRLVEHTHPHTDGFFFGGVPLVGIRNSLRSNNNYMELGKRFWASGEMGDRQRIPLGTVHFKTRLYINTNKQTIIVFTDRMVYY